MKNRRSTSVIASKFKLPILNNKAIFDTNKNINELLVSLVIRNK